VTGADQHGYAGRRTNKIEVAGVEQKAKTRLYWWDIGAKRKKRGFFSYGEVLFLLTSPLIECLSSAVEILLVPRKIQETVEVGVDETSTKQLMKVKEMAALSEMSL
jgi:hypothetical protein